eukprot:11905460-Alexandrium_andersonii.AAC.1
MCIRDRFSSTLVNVQQLFLGACAPRANNYIACASTAHYLTRTLRTLKTRAGHSGHSGLGPDTQDTQDSGRTLRTLKTRPGHSGHCAVS